MSLLAPLVSSRAIPDKLKIKPSSETVLVPKGQPAKKEFVIDTSLPKRRRLQSDKDTNRRSDIRDAVTKIDTGTGDEAIDKMEAVDEN